MNGCSRRAVAADVVFDGEKKHDDFAVVIEDTRIAALTRRSDLPTSIEVYNVAQGAWLAPGFIDIQVNGGGDVLFNADPTPAALAAIAQAHRKFGVTSLLPTLITDSDEAMAAALGAVSAVMAHEPGILGVHLEGPFLSPEKPGVHRREFIRRPQPHHRQMLGAFREGVLLVTLAPEEAPNCFIAELVAAGAKVSLGHSMATYEQTRAAMAEGLTGFTHLFNAMRPLSAREPGPVAAALESPDAYYGMIVDGEHVAPAMLGLAMRGVGRPMLVSDAMPPVGGIKTEFDLLGARIMVRDGSCRTQEGALAGSSIEMASAVRNCVRLLGLPLERALRCASRHPAEFLGLGRSLGRLAPGYRADMAAFDPKDISVSAAWVAGERSDYYPGA
ncbi:N-acetylglucosamine-6-phosphate deacetylase [Methylocystis sp. H4A]|uniref:N-acetylglucosamine-6-phosphate deacetylase n=1 Tax=Methylocystis sp. H4A TaxID=2785788 RepID=UPI0018C2763F|nr:N-acetylglucosamine-6-phosphate deacetylase [Methylocystis sp. H4A]MBG0802683.1 N-acetylglucosamine-6-phosphate deacetylase [Methylocystis sp. H4A]